MRKRSEMVERSFAHVLDRGGMRRAWLRGRENVHKRYLIHVAGFNLGILMRALFGSGTPREAASAKSAILFVIPVGLPTANSHAALGVTDMGGNELVDSRIGKDGRPAMT